jgi:uncharacterized protein
VRIVADSNTLIAAVLWDGLPSLLLVLVERGKIELYTSRYILEEVDDVVRRPRFTRRLALIGRKPTAIMRELRVVCLLVSPADMPPTYRDPDDDVVLATALSARAKVIVTGDNDLLVLRKFRGIPTLLVREFLARYFPELLAHP